MTASTSLSTRSATLRFVFTQNRRSSRNSSWKTDSLGRLLDTHFFPELGYGLRRNSVFERTLKGL